MLFNSQNFIIFFAVVFSLYYFVLKEKTKPQNVLLLVASYIFYAWANWKILPLLAVTTLVFYVLGIAIFEAKTEKREQLFTTVGIILGVGVLLYFKYTNFFISSFMDLFESLGLRTNLHTFKNIMPIGISFYTFRLLSYIIDINQGKIEPTRDIVAFATYVAFFPCILSGPIDRPATLIPQLQKKRTFDYTLTVDGLRQILWGLFKKMVIADGCAIYVNHVFNSDIHTQTASTLILAAILYSFQMYADFSGYSDMAIGIAKLLGFRVTRNFDYPFFAQNIAEFWRKWHISLTSWLTDYIFTPLNFLWRKRRTRGLMMAIIVNFVICGMWHGDNWKFALFGLYHGLLFIPLILSGSMFQQNEISTYRWGFPKPKVLFNIILTFALVTVGLIIFRAENIGQAFEYIGHIFDKSILSMPFKMERIYYIPLFLNLVAMFTIEWFQRQKEHGLDLAGIKSHVLKFSIYFVLLGLLFVFGEYHVELFIYFQF